MVDNVCRNCSREVRLSLALLVLLLMSLPRSASAIDCNHANLVSILDGYKKAWNDGNFGDLDGKIGDNYQRIALPIKATVGVKNGGAAVWDSKGEEGWNTLKQSITSDRTYWQGIAVAYDVAKSDCSQLSETGSGFEGDATIAWTFSGTFKKTGHAVKDHPGTSRLFFDSDGKIYHEVWTTDDAELVAAATRTVQDPGANRVPPVGGTLYGKILVNGDYPASGTAVDCIDSVSPVATDANGTNATGDYSCTSVDAGSVTLRVAGRTAAEPCPYPAQDNVAVKCDVEITGCSNPTVTFSGLAIWPTAALPKLRSRWKKRRTEHTYT